MRDHRCKLVEGYADKKLLFDREAGRWENENMANTEPGEIERLSKLCIEA